MKNKVTEKQRKGRAMKAKQRQWRESSRVVGILAVSGGFTKKSPGRRSAEKLVSEVPEWHQSATQSGDLTDISEVGFGGGESGLQKIAAGYCSLRPKRDTTAEGERIIVKCEFLFE